MIWRHELSLSLLDLGKPTLGSPLAFLYLWHGEWHLAQPFPMPLVPEFSYSLASTPGERKVSQPSEQWQRMGTDL